jgi:hypothetical protein|tara:strand:+ start:1853 stop:3409 length:1557 start_codon:yes stop_codon:yes gene_type:complete
MAREKPIPRNRRKLLNRGLLRSRNDDNVKNFSIGLMDIDGAIMFYFNNVIKPSVEENGEKIKVPIMYSNPERWGIVQKRGFLVDNKKQLIIPLIAFKRTSIEKDNTLGVDKLNPRDPKLFYTFQKQYTQKNRYDKFAVQQGLNKQKELYSVAVPDYVTLSYDFVIWTSYIEQMNSIVEQIIYSEGSYWGEDGKFKFRTKIDNYTDASEVSANTERLIRTNFTVTLNGYLIPEQFSEVVTTRKELTPKKIIINDGIGIDIADLTDGKQDIRVSVAQSPAASSTLANPFTLSEGTGVSIGNAGTFDGSSAANFTFSIGQDVSTSSTVQFNNVSASNAIHVGPTSFEIAQRDDGKAQVNTDWVVLGDIIAENYLINSTVTTMTQSFSSGSTIFGDSIDDTHQFTGSVDVSGSLTLNGGELLNSTTVTVMDTYLRKSFVKKAVSISNNSTASFTAVTASAPSGLTATSENDFVFFINGQYMEHDALTIQQAASSFLLKVNADSIGYDLESDDEIIAMGKFNS